MKWRKQGRIYVPDGSMPWATKYAFPPTPLLRADGTLRIYVAFCDVDTVGRIGYVDVDPTNPSSVLAVSSHPVLDIGQPGSFDENGVVPTCILPVGEALYLFYVGFQLGHKVRYYQFEGLAISTDGGETFQRHSEVPIIDRSSSERLHRTSAFVLHEHDVFKMWYVAGNQWIQGRGKMLPVYNLRFIESPDGKSWPTAGEVCLDFMTDDEHAFGRPWVWRDQERYRMTFSVRTRSKGYRLGYADSLDGRHWTRNDAAVGLDVSPSGWDSEMVEYASVVDAGGRTYLFYNGNNCGESGFGYAQLEA